MHTLWVHRGDIRSADVMRQAVGLFASLKSNTGGSSSHLDANMARKISQIHHTVVVNPPTAKAAPTAVTEQEEWCVKNKDRYSMHRGGR